MDILATEVELKSGVITLYVNHAFITLSEPGHSIKLGIINLPTSEIMIISNFSNDAVLSETNKPLKKKQCIKLDNKIRLPKLQSYQKLLITNQCNFDAISVTMINFGVFSNIKMTNNSRKASLSGRVPWNARIPFVYLCNVEKTHNIDNLCIYPF